MQDDRMARSIVIIIFHIRKPNVLYIYIYNVDDDCIGKQCRDKPYFHKKIWREIVCTSQTCAIGVGEKLGDTYRH